MFKKAIRVTLALHFIEWRGLIHLTVYKIINISIIMVSAPELKKSLDKKLTIFLNGNRIIEGKLTGYDIFLNLTINNAVEKIKLNKSGDKFDIVDIGECVVRGNSIVSLEILD